MTSYFVRRDSQESSQGDVILEAGVNLLTGEDHFQEAFGVLTSLESDLLLIGAAVLAADRATARGEREDVARRIKLNIPVVSISRLMPEARNIELMLRTLSNDAWRITFRQAQGTPELPSAIDESEIDGRTLLFSGGLDSLAAAIEFGSQRGQLQLISHVTRNQQTDQAQQQLVSAMKEYGFDLPHYQFFVSSRDRGPSELHHAEENTQRTRSFLFLILAALSARRRGHPEIVYIAENGQMAIHLPITQGRIGAFSTHTAFPDFLVDMERFLSSVLTAPIRVRNPYVHLTKAEVVKKIVDTCPEAISLSNSCWRNARLSAGVTHCGECIPCYIRRIAIETWQPDQSAYGRDVWLENIATLGADDTGKRNLVDLAEFIVRIERSSEEEIMSEWPELYSENIDAPEVISMYKRFSSEARAVLQKYSSLIPLLS